jgi:hypothetical protein
MSDFTEPPLEELAVLSARQSRDELDRARTLQGRQTGAAIELQLVD